MKYTDALIAELDQETNATRALLDRVPEDKLTWKPHPKSMTLGQLALHIAAVPGNLCEIALADDFPVPDFAENPSPANKAEIMTMLDDSAAQAKRMLAKVDDAKLDGMWRLMKGDQALMEVPRAAVLRSFMMNHLYHHRGQLTVYLRMQDVPLPPTYGASADENPFA